MAVTRQYFHAKVPSTTLASGANATTTSLTVTSASGWPSTNFPHGIKVTNLDGTNEHILVGGRSGTTLTSCTRNWDAGIGVATGTGIALDAGATVEIVLNAVVLNDLAYLLDVTAAGDTIYYDGSTYVKLAKSTKVAESFLKGGTTPSWDWANLPVYTSTSNRTSDNAAPAAGDGSYLNTGDTTEGLEFYHGSAWGKSWNMAWGLATTPVSSTSDQTAISTLADITFATITWTALANRLYRITLSILPNQITSTGNQLVGIYTGSSGAGTLIGSDGGSVTNGFSGPGSVVAYQTGSGSTSVHGRASTSGGTITVANATSKGWIVVEDVGPTGAAP